MSERDVHPMLDLAAWDAANEVKGLVVADGQSVTVNVYGGMLTIHDGPMGDVRKREWARVPSVVKHLVILTSHGYVSLDAMQWMNDCGITWSIISRQKDESSTLATSGRYVNPLYMRQQAMCGPGMPAANTGRKIFRYLITRKLEGQAHVAERYLRDEVAAKAILARIDNVSVARDINAIMGHEGEAAKTYWQAWVGMPIPWKGTKPRQPHWLAFPSRSTLGHEWDSNRGATDPVNAMLNFAYSCAETECILACYAYALSPAMGIGHVYRPGRESFALDLIEVMRPMCDAIVFGLIAERLDKRLFAESRDGKVRLRAPLTHSIAAQVHAEAIEIVKALVTIIPLLNSPQSRRAGIKSDSD